MAFLKCLKYWILSAEGNSCVKASTMLLSLSVQNVFRSVIEGSILFRELAKYFLWQKQLPVLDLYRTNMRSMSSFFINKHWGSKWCHCHIKILQFESQVHRKHFCNPPMCHGTKSCNIFDLYVRWNDCNSFWCTSLTNFSPLFYSFKQLAINHLQYLKQIQIFFH